MGWKWAWRLLCISSISTSTSTQTGHTYILLKGNHMSPFLLLLPWSRPSHYPLLTSIQRCAATQLSYNKNNKTLICTACRFPVCKFSHYGLCQATDNLAIMSWQNSWICNHQLPCTIVSWLKPTTDSTHYSMHRSPVITLLKNLEKLPSTWALSAKSLAEFPVPCTPRHRPPLQSHVVPPFNYTPAVFFSFGSSTLSWSLFGHWAIEYVLPRSLHLDNFCFPRYQCKHSLPRQTLKTLT